MTNHCDQPADSSGDSLALNQRLEELKALWTDASSDSFQRIPQTCREVERLASRLDGRARVDRQALQRIGLLSAKAEQRLAECVAIQTRSGAYATNGAPEALARLATSGWEG